MKDYINIGSTPVEEDCAQVGQPDYPEQSRKECQVFKKQLLRKFGEPPMSTRLAIKEFPHDFGTYREVVVVYDDQDREGLEYALKLEGETPEKWDEEAKKVLGLCLSG